MMETDKNRDCQFLIQMSPYRYRGKSVDDRQTGDNRPTHRLVWHQGSSSKIEHYKGLASQKALQTMILMSTFQRGWECEGQFDRLQANRGTISQTARMSHEDMPAGKRLGMQGFSTLPSEVS